ncbi:transcription initiation factor IIF subunit alpha RAP74 [Perilla frutescens var. hirtella]|uniref:Transcription initiation factor IIF subunit alpha n=1 Tax=Perilla frutescens var. hirtella TaxID=608512 RepID=A0AAD4J489_PERFH|nr:transcription initiation factor IIF subunit alpha RAP74 [Perilla frutescens var. frutescens]KAH6787728.1 transcription initiation factor IIF subunit alpha RAP74 [Perilla frutescens var. hirtella]KAH6826918.1 transcription initiation factor IIF subunit alpha RAP74 [Perilla frutescens var. hirtella]
MSFDLILKPSCGGCGSTVELYGSTCKHLTLCVNCGKSMAEKRSKCYECGTPITRLIREYNVRASSSNDKNYFIARFASGLPNFKKKNENKWSLQKEGLQGRQVTDTLREKFKNKPWLLEDETGQFQYHGHLEGTQTATYYLLMLQGKEFVAIPAGSWYNFSKVAQYKQLTLEEAEEKMKNRRRTADGYQRWMMKAAHNGAAAFGEVEKFDDREGAGGGPRGGDLDFDDDDIEKGDDWEHEEIFTDDDEAVGIDPEEREDLAPEIPAPPEIKQTEEDISPVLAPKKEAPKEEPVDNSSPLKAATSAAGRGTPSNSKSSKGKRKSSGEESKTPNSAPLKKVKTENELKPVKDENASSSKSAAPGKGAPAPASSKSTPTPSTGPVTEDEIRTVLLQKTPVTTQDLVAKFKSRLKLKEVVTAEYVWNAMQDKDAFAAILRRISKIQKTNGANFVVLRERS